MRLFLKMFIMLMPLLLSACAARYQQVELNPGGVRPKLSNTSSVLVATPQDGRYGAIVYEVSGRHTATALVRAFSKHVSDVHLEPAYESLEQSLSTSRKKGYAYLAYPEIKHWEERATEWSGKPDRIEVQITVADVPTGEKLDSVLLVGSSKWATLGGDHPEELLEDPVQKYVDSLYR